MNKYKRNAPLVLSQLHENKSGQILTKVPLKIMAPVRFSEIGLGQIGISTFMFGMLAVILDSGEYGVLSANAFLELNPYKLSISTIDEIDYHVFYFKAGDVVIKTTDLVKKETMLFNVFDEFIFKGKVPWYTEYEDLGKLFNTAAYHADSKAVQNPEVVEFIASMISRSNKDRMKYIREVINSPSECNLETVDYVALKSVFYSVKSTVSKLTGSYFNDGVTSALVNPSKSITAVERILRA